MADLLKDCPACGHEALFQGNLAVMAICGKCYLHTVVCSTTEEAAKQWNNRPVEDAMKERIAKLEELISDMLCVMQGSTGVVGYYPNGDVAKWDELGLVERATELLKRGY